MIVSCVVCSKDTDRRPVLIRKFKGNVYCSKECFTKKQRQRFPAVLKNCIECGEDFKSYPSDEKYKRGNLCSFECKVKWLRGDNHFRFKNASSEAEKLRKSKEYRSWRTSVFIRDGKMCVLCGSKERIEADHILPRYLFPELTLELSNGRTLCHECHTKTDSYMNPYLKREDFL